MKIVLACPSCGCTEWERAVQDDEYDAPIFLCVECGELADTEEMTSVVEETEEAEE